MVEKQVHDSNWSIKIFIFVGKCPQTGQKDVT
jgi:hypothetical protein